MNVPDDLKFAETHEWIRVDGKVGTVGITDHAQAELTDIVFAEAPKVGTKVSAKEALAVVESVKAASDIYSPVGGRCRRSERGPVRQSGVDQSRPLRRGMDLQDQDR